MKCYKVVAIDKDDNMFSAWTIRFKDKWPKIVLEYSLGFPTYPEVGDIMAFSTVEAARHFLRTTCHDYTKDKFFLTIRYAVIECRAVKSKRKGPLCFVHIHSLNSRPIVIQDAFERMWNGECNFLTQISCEQTNLPNDTVFASKLTPIKIIYKEN